MRQADPLFGIIGWSDFMAAVHVRAWRVHEPRRAVPVALLRRAILAVDQTSFCEVQMVVLILVLLFSFARSESPCAETLNGFDVHKHLCVEDFVVSSWDGQLYVRIRLKSIKQDPRMERPEAVGNEDWICIGDVNGDDAFSIIVWAQRLFAFHGSAREALSPFFVHTSRVGPLTYGAAITQFRALLARVSSPEEAARYGLHGLRVAGWNGARQEDAELAVAHGGWHSGSQHRYDRWGRRAILSISASVLAGNSSLSFVSCERR